MRIIARRTLRVFWEAPGHRDAEQPLRAWFAVAKVAEWRGPANVKAEIRTASILRGNRIVFNIAGNKYRLVVHARYDLRRIYIRFVGTHRDYDRIVAEDI